jgi:hypothetical protein
VGGIEGGEDTVALGNRTVVIIAGCHAIGHSPKPPGQEPQHSAWLCIVSIISPPLIWKKPLFALFKPLGDKQMGARDLFPAVGARETIGKSLG